MKVPIPVEGTVLVLALFLLRKDIISESFQKKSSKKPLPIHSWHM